MCENKLKEKIKYTSYTSCPNMWRFIFIFIFILVVNPSQNMVKSYHLFHSKTEFMWPRSKIIMLTEIGQKVHKTNPKRIKWCRGLDIIQREKHIETKVLFRKYLQILSICQNYAWKQQIVNCLLILYNCW